MCHYYIVYTQTELIKVLPVKMCFLSNSYLSILQAGHYVSKIQNIQHLVLEKKVITFLNSGILGA